MNLDADIIHNDFLAAKSVNVNDYFDTLPQA
jgi:hypothetical protein